MVCGSRIDFLLWSVDSQCFTFILSHMHALYGQFTCKDNYLVRFMTSHPFDRYAAYTDLAALKAASERPLRKSVRVNTLKYSVEQFTQWARQNNWRLEPVLWCEEGFFVDREDREQALGKDLLHLLGYIYMQEASSMLPVELLDPQPGDRVLDMSAAPGSKTTQIAAKMSIDEIQEEPYIKRKSTGLIVANDPQSKRLLTLKSALHRLGVNNVMLSNKTGQWFGHHMVEKFDRVLCDAPCTAQGTARKDPDALKYSSDLSVQKAAGLQKELLEAAVHACKVGGRIVYSTCTLTSEENEEVVSYIMNKYVEQLSQLPVKKCLKAGLERSMKDSKKVDKSSLAARVWPQTYDTEGFFCAVLEKTASTKDAPRMEAKPLREQLVGKKQHASIEQQLENLYGTSFLYDNDQLFRMDDEIILGSKTMMSAYLPLTDFALGIPFAKELKDGTLRITNELACARGHLATENVVSLSDDQLTDILAGKDSTYECEVAGDVVLQWNNMQLGVALARDGKLKNRLPRWLIEHRSV